jgi:predicted ATPase/DNA-binding CsgD family transcriptional regulator
VILSLPADSQATLPVPPNRLVGREQDYTALSKLLEDQHSRLVTLTGPGGVGKTHLSLELGATVASRFPDGVVFVSLSSIRDPELVLPAIAQALGLRETAGQPLIHLVRDAITSQNMLIVIDNFEQVMQAGPHIGVLLATTRTPKILVTSRSPLNLRMEREYPVHPLPLPPLLLASNTGSLEDNAAVALFVERAQAARPSFALTDTNAAAIVEICRRLDGLPLAIELAAAMTRVLSPQALLARMEHRLSLLVAGATDLPDRQRTLRDTIAWSHDLLTKEEQMVFRRLAVFVGDASLDAIEAVAGDPGAASSSTTAIQNIDVLSVVSSLVNKSLIVQIDDGDSTGSSMDAPRFRMLATIREFATEQLEASGEVDAVRQLHLDWVIRFAEKAEPQLTGPDQAQWLVRLDAEHDNIRAALTWAQDHCHEKGMRLASMLWRYRATHGLLTEGHTWLCRFLDSPVHAGERIRAKAFSSLGNLSLDLGDYHAASEAYQEALESWERLGHTRGIADALNGQGLVDWYRGDYDSARRRHERSLELRRSIGDRFGQGNSLTNLGNAVKDSGDPLAARELHQQALAIRQSIGHRVGVGVGYSYLNLGHVARRLEDVAEARAMFSKCLDTFQDIGDTLGVAYALHGLGLADMLSGDARQAGVNFLGALQIRLELGDRRGVVESVEGVASVAASLGQPPVAATLFGAASALREQIGAPMPAPDRPRHEKLVESVRRSLPLAAFSSNWKTGTGLSLPEAADLALAAAREVTSALEQPAGMLSGREVEVLQLVAAGMTNAQVAEQLFLSRRTVDAHLRRIYDKLDLSSRAEAIRFAMDGGFA